MSSRRRRSKSPVRRKSVKNDFEVVPSNRDPQKPCLIIKKGNKLMKRCFDTFNKDKEEVIAMLKSSGVSVNSQHEDELYNSYIQASNRYLKSQYRSQGRDQAKLYQAIRIGDADAVEMYLNDYEVDPAKDNFKALLLAAIKGHYDTLDRLISHPRTKNSIRVNPVGLKVLFSTLAQFFDESFKGVPDLSPYPGVDFDRSQINSYNKRLMANLAIIAYSGKTPNQEK